MTLSAILLFCISFKSSVFIVFSRVVHREPNVPSTIYKGSTLYEERDGMFGTQRPSSLEERRIRSGWKENIGIVMKHITCDNFRKFCIFKGMDSL